MLYKEWLTQWLEVYKRRTIKNSTYQGYLQYIKHLQELYCKDVQAVTVFDCQAVINRMADEGLSLSAIKHTLTVLRQSLSKAVQLGARSDNPALCIDLPQSERAQIHALNDIECAQLVAHRRECIYSDVFLFLLYTGVRVGEAIALELGDIDFINNMLYIRRSAYRGDVTAPKTADGVRCIPLNADLVRLLRRAVRGHRSGLVFRNKNGGIINYNSLLKAWHRLQLKCGYRTQYGLHVFRHTFATRMLRAKIDVKTISSLLGHSDVTVTLNVYCDCDFSLMRSAMDTMQVKYQRI